MTPRELVRAVEALEARLDPPARTRLEVFVVNSVTGLQADGTPPPPPGPGVITVRIVPHPSDSGSRNAATPAYPTPCTVSHAHRKEPADA